MYVNRVVPLWRAAVPAALLLHLQTSTVLGLLDSVEDAGRHRRLAATLLDRMARVERDLPPDQAARFREIRRRAHVLLGVAARSRDLEFDALDAHLRQSLRAFPDDPDLLFASGWIEETKAQPALLQNRYAERAQATAAGEPQRLDCARARVSPVARRGALSSGARARHRRTARRALRLGRVLMLQNRLDDARAALGRAGGATDRLACAISARSSPRGIEEQARRPRSAKQQYETALRVWPSSQAARIAPRAAC